ncbi:MULTISPECIES: cupin domain-containing protein [unclassified Methylobacterium]|uniref:cupin domain-containing protein n=1 Tax=unclassified Methylobacterium TaxID=2615210 RepID=UPI001FB8876D|nr:MULTISPECIES: cupin domain-containing protein [unclassified Methylobacterium]MCJ2095122.1 cupin domain-containing protein [Methylobacterium sp. J-072]MCJ2139325.1 cupin domain-containing protein [Methylobacterium sp. E-066]
MPADPVDRAVGQRLRALRQERHLSLEKVAASTGLSIGFISQVERGLSSPSLRVLALLADTLQTGIGGLFEAAPSEKDPDPIVVFERDRAELKLWRAGITKQLLTPVGGTQSLSLFHMVLEPKASTGEELFSHDGEEAGLVLEGRMTLIVEARTLELATGDSFRFASHRPHRFSNPDGRTRAVVLWVNALRIDQAAAP